MIDWKSSEKIKKRKEYRINKEEIKKGKKIKKERDG